MLSKKKHTQKLNKRTWYGLTATVAISPGFIHWSGWEFFLIPHPPMVNLLLRLYLKERKEVLIFAHEFQHLQSAPFFILYTAIMLVLAFLKGYMGFTELFFILASAQAAWEIISEFLTLHENKSLYRKAYNNITMFPRIVFWFSTIILSLWGWLMILR